MNNKSDRNKTLVINNDERASLLSKITTEYKENAVIQGLQENLVNSIPDATVSLLILDPPYNLTKNFNTSSFKKTSVDDYTNYIDEILKLYLTKLKNNATLYICGDWLSSTSIYTSASKYFYIRNRITWEREKGRGSKTNWKNCSEDIWFCTKSNEYIFNESDVKLKKTVIAPYKENGNAKDWQENDDGKFRYTSPSNFMGDITIPFWSMPENTAHPTQKPEKLIAKLILASSNEGDLVVDPFGGSGTTAVVCKKLNRRFVIIEKDQDYCLYTQKRLNNADINKRIQGYDGNAFLERGKLL